MNLWMDTASVATLFAIGNIFFGHFEEHTPKWRRVLKFAVMLVLTMLIAWRFGDSAALAFVALASAAGLTAHFVITRRYGIDPWTAEPKDKYYALRGWTR